MAKVLCVLALIALVHSGKFNVCVFFKCAQSEELKKNLRKLG